MGNVIYEIEIAYEKYAKHYVSTTEPKEESNGNASFLSITPSDGKTMKINLNRVDRYEIKKKTI